MTLIYHFGWNGCAKPRWQDHVFNAQRFLHTSHHQPPRRQIVLSLIFAVIGTAALKAWETGKESALRAFFTQLLTPA